MLDPNDQTTSESNDDSTPAPLSKQSANLKQLLAEINKQFHNKDLSLDQPIKFLSDITPLEDKDIIPSGIYELNNSLCVGGFARGRLHEIRGVSGAGKTTCAIHAMVEAQRKFPDQFVGYIDSEHALDCKYAEALGLDLSRVVINSPISGEEGLGIADKLTASGEFSLVVIDSVAGLIPTKILRHEHDKDIIGSAAAMFSKSIPRIVSSAGRTQTCILLINQVRNKIGAMGDPTISPGGNAIEFYTTTRTNLTRNNTQDLIDKGINTINAKVFKNKLGTPGEKCSYTLYFGKGVPKFSQALSFGVDNGLIEKGKSGWYTYKDERIHGETKMLSYLEENPDIVEAIFNGEC